MKKISLEEAYISPYFSKYCINDGLLEYKVFTGDNKDNYDYLLDPENKRFKQADKDNITYIISATVPGSQNLKNMNDAPIFCKLTNDYFKEKVDLYNKKNNTHHSFFAVLPFNNPKSCLEELIRINNFNPPINRVLFNGPTQNNKKYDWLEDNKWSEVWSYANKHKTVFYSHPFVALSYSDKLPDKRMKDYVFKHPQIIGSQFGFHINDALFILKLYINNIFDNYPNIQWMLGHMGETLLWYLWRFDHRTKIYKDEIKNVKSYSEKDNKLKVMKFPKKKLIDLFKTQKGKKHAQIVSTTSGWFNTPSLKFAIDTVGIENVLFSIDTPYENYKEAVNWFNKLKLSHNYKNKLGWKNANDLLSIFPKTHVKKTLKKNHVKKNRINNTKKKY